MEILDQDSKNIIQLIVNAYNVSCSFYHLVLWVDLYSAHKIKWALVNPKADPFMLLFSVKCVVCVSYGSKLNL